MGLVCTIMLFRWAAPRVEIRRLTDNSFCVRRRRIRTLAGSEVLVTSCHIIILPHLILILYTVSVTVTVMYTCLHFTARSLPPSPSRVKTLHNLELVQRSEGRQHRGSRGEVEVESVSPQGAVRHRPRHPRLLTSSSSILSPGICSVRHHPHALCRLVFRLSSLFLLATILGWSGSILNVVICQPNCPPALLSSGLWPGLDFSISTVDFNYI